MNLDSFRRSALIARDQATAAAYFSTSLMLRRREEAGEVQESIAQLPCRCSRAKNSAFRLPHIRSGPAHRLGALQPTLGKAAPARTGRPLLAQAKALDNLAIPIRVATVEIVQQATAAVDHHDQSASRSVVLHVRLQMRSEIVNSLAQQGNLNLGGACVLRMRAVLLDQH